MAWRDLALEVDRRKYYGQAVADFLLRETDGDCLFHSTQASIADATGVRRQTVGTLLGKFQDAGLIEKAGNGYRLTIPGERSRRLPEFRSVRDGWPGDLRSDREAEILSVVFEHADWSGHCPRRALPESLRWTESDFRDLQRMRLGGVLDGFSVFECLILPMHSVRSGCVRDEESKDGEDMGRTCGIDHRAGHGDVQTILKLWRQIEARSILRNRPAVEAVPDRDLGVRSSILSDEPDTALTEWLRMIQKHPKGALWESKWPQPASLRAA